VITPTFLSPIANHLWQSTLFVVIAGLLTLTLKRNQARTRHWIWLAASLKFLVPFSLLIALGSHFSSSMERARSFEPSVATLMMDQIAQPFTGGVPTAIPTRGPSSTNYAISDVVAPALTAIWICGSSIVLFRWWRSWRRIHQMVKGGTALKEGPEVETLGRLKTSIGMPRSIAIICSATAIEPSVFGVIHPVLLWPAGLTPHLSDKELEAILLHELSHIRRRDNLAAMLHMWAEAMFWFHPLVWWIGRRLVDERERACDERVLAWGGSSEIYAEGILKVCDFCVESPLPCAAGVSGSDLKRRIEDIMKNRVTSKLSFTRFALLAFAAMIALAGPFMLGITHARSARLLILPTLEVPHIQPPVITTERPMPPRAEVRSEPEPVRPQQVSTPATTGALELIMIRSSVPDPTAVPGARGGLSPTGAGSISGGCKGGPPSIDENRITLNNNSLYTLITWAWGMNCLQVNATDALLGADDWAKYDQWIIAALAPQGSLKQDVSARIIGGPAITKDPVFQQMLQKFLVDHFKISVHHETRTIPTYALVIADGGLKVNPDGPFLPKDAPTPPGAADLRMGPKANISALANFLTIEMHKLVLDQTGIKEGYPISLFFARRNEKSPDGTPLAPLPQALEEQLGLKLQTTTTSVDVLVIDHAERPVQN
jgi:uncharacterized protein (TIGR03435 family)